MAFLEDRTGPLNLAHRGASAVAPQNTLAAFEQAGDMGADGVELDVHLSADGVPVVIHDATVDRTTDGHGRVGALSLEELKSLDAGRWFDPTFAGEQIPTLEEVADALGQRLLVNVELKSISLRENGLERAVIDVIERSALTERVLISSFNPLSLRRVRRLAPHLPLGLLTLPRMPRPLSPLWRALVRVEAHHPHHTQIDRQFVAQARRWGYRIFAWVVDEPAEIRRLADLGVDGIITNVPDRMNETLA